MSTAQRNAIAGPAAGLLVFDTDKGTLFFFDGQLWMPLAFVNPTNIPLMSRSAPDGAMDDVFGYSVAISNNYAIAGAYFDDILTANDNRGSACIFQRNNSS